MHKLFARQLAKATASTGETDLNALGELVSAAYEEQDRDRERTDRSISLMVDELDQLNRGLECLVEERTAALREREEELRKQNLQFDAAINNMSHALVMFDADARLMICNDRYRDMYHLPEELLQPGRVSLPFSNTASASNGSSANPAKYVEKVRDIVDRRQIIEPRLSNCPTAASSPVHNQPMAGGGWVATHEDITERRRAEQKIAHMAGHDALTDLPNRALLRDRLAQALSVAHHGEQLAVLYLDLDHFKAVNDTLGHHIGDELLKTVAGRLRDTVREIDTVARVGGDEFAILCAGVERAARCCGPGAAHRRSGASALRPAGPRRHRRHLDRDCARARRWHRSERTAQERGHGALWRQGRRPRHLPVLRAGDGRAHEDAPHPRARAAAGARQR